jgi:hypothetical protein
MRKTRDLPDTPFFYFEKTIEQEREKGWSVHSISRVDYDGYDDSNECLVIWQYTMDLEINSNLSLFFLKKSKIIPGDIHDFVLKI